LDRGEVHDRQDEQVERATAQHVADGDVRKRGQRGRSEVGEQLGELVVSASSTTPIQPRPRPVFSPNTSP
jgi:hypothetical protein